MSDSGSQSKIISFQKMQIDRFTRSQHRLWFFFMHMETFASILFFIITLMNHCFLLWISTFHFLQTEKRLLLCFLTSRSIKNPNLYNILFVHSCYFNGRGGSRFPNHSNRVEQLQDSNVCISPTLTPPAFYALRNTHFQFYHHDYLNTQLNQ